MERSIVDVARMSGVTARTLRHAPSARPSRRWRVAPEPADGGPDHIGLLRPSSIGPDGYRGYDERALLRLQHVLVLRALGLPLQEIGAVLDEDRDEVAALTEHHDRLLAERDRRGRMAETVTRTLVELVAQDGSGTMTVERPENLFEGFDPKQHEAEARERWPEEAATSEAYTATLSPEDVEGMQQEFTAHLVRLADLRAGGSATGAPAVQEEIDRLHGSVSGLGPRLPVPARREAV